jgi:phosphoenolpyruvate carboxylase
MSEFAALDRRLQELHERTAETPLFNPVFQLGLELSRKMESGELTLDRIETMVAELECEGLRVRARRLNRLVSPVERDTNLTRIGAMAEAGDFAGFAARWNRPVAHIVFTAHPTFLLARAQAQAVAQAASQGDLDSETVCAAPAARDTITLDPNMPMPWPPSPARKRPAMRSTPRCSPPPAPAGPTSGAS